MTYDVFISHASIDKEAVARPLSKALQARGLSVWLDEEQLQVGDSIRREIDLALAQSRFGIVILSPSYLESEWTKKELDALFTKEKYQNKTILPVAHQVSREDIEAFSPMLADKITLSVGEGTEVLADAIQASILGLPDSMKTDAIPPDSGDKPTRWVWRCTEESLENGQVSVLSVLETIWALGLYYLLVQHFQHHWWLLLTAFAAPIILLRSDSSAALGVKMLKNYWDGNNYDVSTLEKIITVVLAGAASFALSYWLAQHWLPDHQGWSLFWRSALIGVAAFAVAFAAATAVASVGVGYSVGLGYNIGAFASTGGFVFAVALVSAATGGFVFVGSFAVAGSFALAVVIFGTAAFGELTEDERIEIVLSALFLPFLGMGIWLRTLFIRVFASLRHPLQGICNLPLNSYRISWGMDFMHPPELLPDAESVSDALTARGLLDRFSNSDETEDIVFVSIFLLIWYIPAQLWRWSLKATLWLWWPLALALAQPFKAENMYQIRQAVVTIVSGWWRWFLIPVIIVIPWLLSGFYPEVVGLADLVLSEQHAKLFKKLMEYTVPNPYSLRYVSIGLACILSIIVWLKASNMKNHFKEILENETIIPSIENDPEQRQLKQDFYQRAEIISRWHTLRIVSFILLGYSYILYLAHAWYPEQASRFIADWLIFYL